MECSGKSLRGILYLVLICLFVQTSRAEKSIYVLDWKGQNIMAFNIVNNELVFQENLNLLLTEGPIDMAIDERTDTIFVSLEKHNAFVLVKASKLENIKFINFSGASDIAGIVYDYARRKLYGIDRDTNKLYIFRWDEINQTLSVNPASPVLLENITYGCDLELNGEALYVSEYGSSEKFRSSQVKAYDVTDNFSYIEVVDMYRDVTAIAYNSEDNCLYGGFYKDDDYFIKKTIDPNTTIVKDGLDYCMIGIATDDDISGSAYTTAYNSGDWAIQMWDTSAWTPTYPSNPTPVYSYTNETYADNLSGIITAGPYRSYESTVSVDDNIDENECVGPQDEITYEITVSPNGYDHEDLRVTAYLGDGVFYDYYKDGPLNPDPNYSPSKNTYTWQIGTLDSDDDSVVLSITVEVTEQAEPLSTLACFVHAVSDVAYDLDTEQTDVCDWGPDVIYVDDTATGYNNGTSWDNAYIYLQDALDRADNSDCKDIWVAGGIYSPGKQTTDTFTIPAGVALYGGLAGNEPSSYDPNDRDIIRYQSILTGLNDSGKNDRVVTMGLNTKLHGFVIEDGHTANVYGDNVDFILDKCIIRNNDDIGIYCQYGNLTANWCIIRNNTDDGIYHEGSSKTLTVNNSKIYGNKENGIWCKNSTLTIKNSEIDRNGEDGYWGIRIEDPTNRPVIQNCTIAFNNKEGVYFEDRSNDMDYPIVKNCILWHNNAGDYPRQIEGFHRTYFSCLDPNYSFAESSDPDTWGNISCDPNFAYININDHNLHLHEFSPCINTGSNSYVSSGQVDIDGEDRIYDDDADVVDMGSDEVSCTDEIYNTLDFNGDGLVNNKEFALFSKAWLTDTDDAAYNKKCDLNTDNNIDLADFVIFAESWAWKACWKDLEQGFAMMGMGMEMSTQPAPEPTVEEQIEQYEYLIDWLEDLWKTDKSVRDEVDKDAFDGMIESLETWLDELEEEL